jgi:hypothetical protein
MNASLPMAERGTGSAIVSKSASAMPAAMERKRHTAIVRVTHWLTTVAFLALLVTGGEIVLSHPRFYWGEDGNVNMPPWLNLHVPSSRDTVARLRPTYRNPTTIRPEITAILPGTCCCAMSFLLSGRYFGQALKIENLPRCATRSERVWVPEKPYR